MADSISAIEPNKLLLMLSKGLRAGREGLNYPGKLPESVPLLGGMGFGDLLMGKSPEALEDYSYGFGPIRGGPTAQTFKLDPRVVDIAGLPVPYVAGSKVTKLGAQKLMAKALKEGVPVDTSRREFMKKAGAVGAAGAGALAVPGAVLKIGSELAPKAAAEVATDIAPRAAAGVAAKSIRSMLDNSVESIRRRFKDVYDEDAISLDDLSSSMVKNKIEFYGKELVEKHGSLHPDFFSAWVDDFPIGGYTDATPGKPERQKLAAEMAKKFTPEQLERIIVTRELPEGFPNSALTQEDIYPYLPLDTRQKIESFKASIDDHFPSTVNVGAILG